MTVSASLIDEPEIIKTNPFIKQFIDNIIETNHGIQLPAILHSLAETFSRDGVTQQILHDPEFMRWVNEILKDKQNITHEMVPSSVGKGVGISVDNNHAHDSNKDPFTLLVPHTSMF